MKDFLLTVVLSTFVLQIATACAMQSQPRINADAKVLAEFTIDAHPVRAPATSEIVVHPHVADRPIGLQVVESSRAPR